MFGLFVIILTLCATALTVLMMLLAWLFGAACDDEIIEAIKNSSDWVDAEIELI